MNKPLTRAEVAIDTTWNLADLFATRDEWLAELAAVERSLESVVRLPGPARDRPGRAAGVPGCARRPADAAGPGQRLRRPARGRGWRQRRAPGRPVECRRGRRARVRGPEVRRQRDPGAAGRHARRLAARRAGAERLSADPGRARGAQALHALARDRARAGEPRRSARRAVHDLQPGEDGRHAVRAVHRCGRHSHPNSFNLYQSTYEADPDTSVRRGAWASFCAGLVPYQHTMGGTFATEVAKNIVLARARGYRQHRALPAAGAQDLVRALHQRARHPAGRAGAAHAPLRPPAPPRSRARQAAVLRHQGAARSRLRAGREVRGSGGAARGRARAARRRVRGAGAKRVPAPLDRPRRQRRQGLGRVLRHALRRALVHPDDVDRLDARRVHARPRARPRGPLHARGAASTARQHRSGDALRRGAVDHERGPAGASSPGPALPTRACAAGC